MTEAPRPPRTRAHRLRDRLSIEQGLAEMMGIVQGVIADGRVSEEEAQRLASWARANPEIARRWPANLLARRLEQIFEDGRVDGRERKHLAAILGQMARTPGALADLSTDLPVDDPPPPVVFEGQTFVFAGELAYGPTRACEREVVDLGGECERAVTRRTDYLVIGSIGAEDWRQQSFGRQVDQVVQQRARGATMAIISEETWAAALP
ncbi:MAG: BRCT domain-containing protein [Longimicrobiales bacterium]